MSNARDFIKRNAPPVVKIAVAMVRNWVANPPIENAMLHDYDFFIDLSGRPRFTLVIPSVLPSLAFGGITTALRFFVKCCQASGADARLVIDDLDGASDLSFLYKLLGELHFGADRLDIAVRRGLVPKLGVRASDVFFSYNCWMTLNIRGVCDFQNASFGLTRMIPIVSIIQDYEPSFYPLSSSHLFARNAFDGGHRAWAMFNSIELKDYFFSQGHKCEEYFAYEPQISAALRAQINPPAEKKRQILVYGRPSIPRNCFPAVVAGLKAWSRRYEQATQWSLISVGTPHREVPLENNCILESRGKLSLIDYAALLKTSAVGLSLMASPHPSYPPLEMAAFGLRTITNTYGPKNLSEKYPNIISLPEISSNAIANALIDACDAFPNYQKPSRTTLAFENRFLREGTDLDVAEFVNRLSSAVRASKPN